VSASRIWVGGYTADLSGMAEGIGLLKVLPDGSLEDHGLAAASDSPSALARSGDVLYAANEGAPGVSAFRIDADELRFLGTQDAAGGLPCSLAVLDNRSMLVAACYENGVVDVHPLSPDGAILKTSQSLHGEGRGTRINQDGPHAHDVVQIDATTVLTTDLGTDHVYVHSLGSEGLTRTASVTLPTGSGPRDLLHFSPDTVWVLTELSAEIFVLRRGPDGFAIVSQIGLPGAEEGDHAAALAVSDDGRFAYAGLRGSDRIAVLEVGFDGGELTPINWVDCGGGWPRHLVVDGPFVRVANQLTNSVVSFRIGDDGMPVKSSSVTVPSPNYLLLD
jgi:6-phosphogluconolactonase